MGELRRLGYRPALDGVRAIAILSVVCWHGLGHPKGGFLGVHIFFVLSGFLITTLLLEEWDARGTISLRHFYFRRALRLLPALVLALIGFAVLTTAELGVGDAPPGLTAHGAVKGALLGFFYVLNIAQAAGASVPGEIGHLWSLATEEQFYLVWPLSLVAVLRAGLSRRAIAIGLIALIVVLAVHRLEMTLRGVPQGRIYFGPDGAFDLLLIGCLAGLIVTSGSSRLLAATVRVTRLTWPAAALVVALSLLIANIYARSVYEWILPLFGVAVALLLLYVTLSEGSLLRRALSLPPLVYLGRISYGVYLWHQIVAAVPRVPVAHAQFVLNTTVTIVIATASYYLVERRFLRRKRRDREQLLAPRALEPAIAAT
jgi:peptidoglycan/LPS O-acetylase OafA/YrhL